MDTILGLDTDGRDMTQWMKILGNTRSKFNEQTVIQIKKLDICTKSLGIREGETLSGAMGERLIELATLVSGLTANNIEVYLSQPSHVRH